MTAFDPMQWSLLSFFLLGLRLVALSAEPLSLFSIEGFQGADLESNFALLGDAQLANGGSCVNLTTHLAPSAGTLVFNQPVKLINGKTGEPVSFSTEFVFSLSPGGNGDGLAFVIVPAGKPSDMFGKGAFGISNNADKIQGKFIAVEFDTRKDDNSKDVEGGRVGVNVGGFVSDQINDVSYVGLLLNGGNKLQSWVDYDGSSKRLEIRLNKFGSEMPYTPLISYSIDLLRMRGRRKVLVGLGSSSGDSAVQISSVYSWNFRVRTIPNWLQSRPLEARVLGNDDEHHTVSKRKDRVLTILGGVIFATGCGTLIAFLILLLWVVFFSRHSDVSIEFPMETSYFNYEKIDVKDDTNDHMNQ